MTKDSDVPRYSSLSTTTRGLADRAMRAACAASLCEQRTGIFAIDIESAGRHLALPSYSLEPPVI